ncbi:MAG: Sua5/YciO/YrdC/YwlC family protein, partial [Caldimonas sp.]
LRERKRRPAKPFAVLARDLAMVERFCHLSSDEAQLLQSAAAPIVLLAANGRERLAGSVAPACRTLGFMLPYTALHHALMARLDAPVVLTSGNLGDEPQCIDDADAIATLAGVADAFLLHDRVIVNRVDDSVARVVGGQSRLLRRGRGHAPASLPLPPGFARAPSVLALGGELKNTICVVREGRATLSQHIGDLGNLRVEAALRTTIALQEQLFAERPQVLAIDRHPTGRAGRIGRDWAADEGLDLIEVQHHHAHIAACLAEHAVPLAAPPVLGIALDGLGWGDDGTLWGGEFLQVDYRSSRRLASLRPVPMPGGEQAIREPWRMGWSYLQTQPEAIQRCAATLPFGKALAKRPVATLSAMQRTGVNSPLTSSCGRLFDAVSALIGVCDHATYEGQAAIELEAHVDAGALAGEIGYEFGLSDSEIHTGPLWPCLLDDLVAGTPIGTIAARFHVGLVDAIVAMAERLTELHADPWEHRIALGGGVFQNAIMLERLQTALRRLDFTVLSPALVPANDGGLSLGQAVVAAARWIDEA